MFLIMSHLCISFLFKMFRNMYLGTTPNQLDFFLLEMLHISSKIKKYKTIPKYNSHLHSKAKTVISFFLLFKKKKSYLFKLLEWAWKSTQIFSISVCRSTTCAAIHRVEEKTFTHAPALRLWADRAWRVWKQKLPFNGWQSAKEKIVNDR